MLTLDMFFNFERSIAEEQTQLSISWLLKLSLEASPIVQIQKLFSAKILL